MSKRIQLRRGTTAETNTFTGAVGEVTVDTDKNTVVVHDGTTVGGHPVATRANTDGTISLIKKDGMSAGVINSAGLFNNTLTSTNTNQALTANQGSKLRIATSYSIGGGGNGVSYGNFYESRGLNTTYTRSSVTLITINATLNTTGAYLTATQISGSGGVLGMSNTANNTSGRVTMTFVVPAGDQYSVTISAGTATINTWMEYFAVGML